MTLAPSPVKTRALALGLPVVQPTKLRTGDFGAWVKAQRADVALVVAYGRILPRDVLEGPRLGCVNVHASLLPKYRGAAPVTWAVVHGETETGITLMLLDEGMDTGAMLEAFPTAVGPDETAGELSVRLAALGARAVREGLPKYVAGGYTPVPQDGARATTAPILKKEDGQMSFAKPARRVHDHVRGMSPWPGAYTRHAGKIVKVHRTAVAGISRAGARPGEVIVADKSRLTLACGEGSVDLVSVQLEGRKPIRGVEWVMGRGVAEGEILG
jgi:methionyl-tRNA formyltransferase